MESQMQQIQSYSIVASDESDTNYGKRCGCKSGKSRAQPLPVQHACGMRWICFTVLNAFLTCACIYTTMKLSPPRCADIQPDSRYSNHQLNAIRKSSSSYSPILDAVDLSPTLEEFHGAVNDNSSIFRQDPSAEVDQAWDLITAEGFEITTATATALVLSGKDPAGSVKAPEDWYRGDNEYIVQVDAFHQLHCLNELRKQIFFDYYYGNKYLDGAVPEEHMIHKKHCIHILLQNIMCHADAEIIPHKWVHYGGLDQPGRPFAEPLADFNTVKKCRNFDALLKWSKKTAIKDLKHKWGALKPPADAAIFDGRDGYFKLGGE